MRLVGFILFLILTSSFSKTEKGMTIRVVGITEIKGNLMLALFDKSEGFGNDNCAIKKQVIKVVQSNQEITLTDLKAGKKYAIALYHDANSNKRLDKNFLGMPIEKYGFSNDARSTFSPPSFESAAFQFNQGAEMTITVK